MEVFLWMGKAGGCAMSHCDSTGRLLTKALNSGTPVEELVKALKGVRCPTPHMENLSCSDAIAKVLEGWEVK
jgi:ribonucleoside-diphosphate reductase alpha chain